MNFGLPNLQGRTPIHVGAGHTLGERGGEPAHTLSIAELPTHTHTLNATSTGGSSPAPGGNILARGQAANSDGTNPVGVRSYISTFPDVARWRDARGYRDQAGRSNSFEWVRGGSNGVE